MGRASSGSADTRRFLIALARAYGGAIIFALPLLMTMEMWHLGSYMPRTRLLGLMLLTIPLLVGLSYHSGFEETFSLLQDSVDAFVALAVGATASALLLLLFGVITSETPPQELIGKIALQTLPASIGALLAQSQFGKSDERNRRQAGYGGGLFLMAVGALFLAWNVAPTEEIQLIAFRVTPLHGLVLAVLSLAIVHSFMFALEFRGQPDIPPDMSAWRLFLGHTVVGYAIALALSLYVQWTFGRLDGTGFDEVLMITVVLAFPAAIGAAAGRLIL